MVKAYKRLRAAGAMRWEAVRLVLMGMVPIAGESGDRFDWKNRIGLLPAIRPVSLSAGTVVSASVDLNDYIGPVGMEVVTGAVTGSLDVKGTECDTSGGQYSDIVNGAITQIVASSQQQMVPLVRTKRFIKISTTVGTGPALTCVNLLGIKKAG
jgi:hypothetical protein